MGVGPEGIKINYFLRFFSVSDSIRLSDGRDVVIFAGRNVVGGRGEPILWVNDAGDGKDWREYSLSGRHNALLPPRRESWKFSP